MKSAQLAAVLDAQLADLAAVASNAGVSIRHVKPHGALYNDAARSRSLSDVVAQATRSLGADVKLVGPPGSELEFAAARADLDYLAEGFVDRAYRADGSLTPRGEPGAVYTDSAAAARQATSIAVHAAVTSSSGEIVPLEVDTLCIHGDTPGAVTSALAVREALEAAGVRIAPWT